MVQEDGEEEREEEAGRKICRLAIADGPGLIRLQMLNEIFF